MKHTLRGINKRTEQGGYEVYLDDEYLSPKHSQVIYNHSPDGFSWGYEGSGCAQLALAILLKIMDKELAVSQYQEFKRKIIAKLPQNQSFDIIFEWPLPEEIHEEDQHADKDLHPDHPDNK